MPPSGSPATREWVAPRIRRDGPILFSVHIPKTAGTRFGQILAARHPRAYAEYYGPESPRTHPALRAYPAHWTAETLDRLHAAGVRVVHGHFRIKPLLNLVPDPSRYIIWLREPVEQTISHYHFIVKQRDGGTPLSRAVLGGGVGLEEFVRIREATNYQSGIVGDLPLAEAGFVGVTELFRPMLPLLGLSDRSRRGNINREKPLVGRDVRDRLVEHLCADLALYSEAMELSVRRLGVRDSGGARLLSRARSIVAGWRPTPSTRAHRASRRGHPMTAAPTAYDPENIFAKILRGELPSETVYEDPSVRVIMDIMPRGPGHALVLPKAPSRNILDIAEDDLAAVMVVAQRVARAAKSAFAADGVTIQHFVEAAGGQMVFHTHVHVIPRFAGIALKPHSSEMAPAEEIRANGAKLRAALGGA
jgi:histidine triad (HIT) family protein